MARSLANNLIFNVLRNISNIIFPLITAPYVARVLDPESLGLANFANTYASYFALVAALGIPNYGVREVAKHRDSTSELSEIFSELFSIGVIITFFVSIVYVLTALFIDQLSSDLLIFIIAGITLFTSPFNIDWYFSGLENFQYITIRSVIIKTISIICLFLFVHDTSDLLIFVLLHSLSTCVSQIWNFIILYRSNIRVKLTLHGFGRHIRPLLLLFSSVLAVSLYTTLNALMLGFMSSYDQVSYYNQSNFISRAFLAVVTSFSEIMVPRLSFLGRTKDWQKINKLIDKSFSMVTLFAFPMSIGIILAAPDFIPLFLGDKFSGTIIPLQIMSVIVVVISLNNISTIQILMGLGYDSKLLRTVLWGTLTNIILNLIMIPYFGAAGSALASVIAEILILIISWFYVAKFTEIKFSSGRDMLISFLSILSFYPICYIVGLFFSGWTLIALEVFICILAYYLLLKILGSKSLKTVEEVILLKINR